MGGMHWAYPPKSVNAILMLNIGTLIFLYFKVISNHVWYHPPLFEIKF